MSQHRFDRLQEIFQRAATLAGDERARLLDEECGGDETLRCEVEDLLARDALPGGVSGGVAEEAGRVLARSELPLPDNIGPYEVLGLLGRGGMGVVYRARQENPERVVALKVLRPSVFSDKLLRRFELETQVLGRLQHRGIAQIFEAGTTDVGLGTQPWFAMELIEGEKLSQWAEEKSTRAKLELVVRLCDAIQHAHLRGVIHRDLKPDNILVDAEDRPKILDFGVARVTDCDLKLTTIQTDVKSLIGTLPYMSPEQAQGESQKLDARSDVYALGVLTYELLTGELPYDLRDKPVAVAARVITDEDHAPLSSVDRVFRGDIDTIVGKALEKEPERRYATAEELAADVQRYLHDEPIQARPPSTIYQLKKFARRHRGLVAGLATTFVILVGAVIGLSILTIKATRAERVASRQLEIMSGVNRYLDRILTSGNPDQTGEAVGREMKVIDVLDAASAEVAEVFADHPEQEAAIRMMLGTGYLNSRGVEKALPEFERALALFEEHAEDERRVLEAKMEIAAILPPDRAIPMQREILDAYRRLGTLDEPYFEVVTDLSSALHTTSRTDLALELVQSEREACRRTLGERSRSHR